MKFIKQLFIIVILFLVFLPTFIYANKTSSIELFYSSTCPHCIREKEFLGILKDKYKDEVNIIMHETSKNTELMMERYDELKVPIDQRGYVPFTVFDNKYHIGFDDTIKQEIEKYILGESNMLLKDNEVNSTKISVPLIGSLNTSQIALPFLSIILGFLDGFNVCSLGALIIILALVLGLKSRVQTLIFGSTFIVTTSVVYGFLIFFWYKLFSFITPYIKTMEILLGLITLLGGLYFLRQFIQFLKEGPACEIGTAQKLQSKFSTQFKEMIKDKKNIALIIGFIFLFALIITVVEFPCSAAIPVVYAGILTQAKLPFILYIIYMTIYLFFYMLDEIIIFLIAFVTTKLWLPVYKWTTWITLLEALILLSFSAYYLFRIF